MEPRKGSSLQWLLLLAGGAVLLPALALMAVAFLSLVLRPPEQRLGEEKRIAGPGSHLLFSVVEAERGAGWAGEPELEPLVEGSLWRFRVRARNDAAGAALVIDPVRTRVIVVDEDGSEHAPLATLDPDSDAIASIAGDLHQGELRERDFYFDLPAALERPRLWAYPDDPISRYLPLGRRNLLTPKLVYAHDP